MPLKFKDILPEKDYAGWLGLGLILLLASQFLSYQTGTLAIVFRWLLLAAAAVNYGVILYLYDRDRRAKKQKQAAGSGDEKSKSLKS